MKQFLMFISMIIIFSSCATILTGTKTAIQFDSEPSGATVEMDGLEIGTTPFVYNVKKSYNGIISFEKDGYQRKTASIPKSFNGVAIINLFSLVSWAVDFATGAINKFDMKGVDVTLQKED